MGPVDISIEGLALAVVSWESLLRVGDVKSSINSSLQGSENLNRIIVKMNFIIELKLFELREIKQLLLKIYLSIHQEPKESAIGRVNWP